MVLKPKSRHNKFYNILKQKQNLNINVCILRAKSRHYDTQTHTFAMMHKLQFHRPNNLDMRGCNSCVHKTPPNVIACFWNHAKNKAIFFTYNW